MIKQKVKYWKRSSLILEGIFDKEEVDKLRFEYNSWEIKKDMFGNIISAKWTPPIYRLTVEDDLKYYDEDKIQEILK